MTVSPDKRNSILMRGHFVDGIALDAIAQCMQGAGGALWLGPSQVYQLLESDTDTPGLHSKIQEASEIVTMFHIGGAHFASAALKKGSDVAITIDSLQEYLDFLLRSADTRATTSANKHTRAQMQAQPAPNLARSTEQVPSAPAPPSSGPPPLHTQRSERVWRFPPTQSGQPWGLRLEAAGQVPVSSTRSRYRLAIQVEAYLSWDADAP